MDSRIVQLNCCVSNQYTWKDLQDGPSRSCWEAFEPLFSPHQSVHVEATKSSCQCHPWCVPNKNRVLSLAPVSYVCGQDGSQESWQKQWQTYLLYQNPNREILSLKASSFSRMFRFSELDGIKAAWKKKEKKTTCTEICCWKLFTFYQSFCFIVTLAATFLSSVTV